MLELPKNSKFITCRLDFCKKRLLIGEPDYFETETIGRVAGYQIGRVHSHGHQGFEGCAAYLMKTAKQIAILGGVEGKAVAGRVDKIFSASAARRHENWEAGCHRLVDDQAPRLTAAGEDKAAGEGVEGGQVAGALMSGEVDIRGKGGGGCQVAEGLRFGAVADENEGPCATPLAIGEPSLNEAVDVLLFREPADVEEVSFGKIEVSGRLAAKNLGAVSEEGVVDNIVKPADAVGGEAKLLEIPPVGGPSGDGRVKEGADQERFDCLFPSDAGVIVGGTLGHKDAGAPMQLRPERGGERGKGIVAGNENDLGVELREVAPKLAREAKLAGLAPAGFGHEGVYGEIGWKIFTEFKAGVDSDAADEFDAADATGQGGRRHEAAKAGDVVGVPVDPDYSDLAGAGGNGGGWVLKNRIRHGESLRSGSTACALRDGEASREHGGPSAK